MHPNGGFMNTPQRWAQIPDGIVWAADNGRFASPHTYTDDGFLAWLDRQPRETCLFAVAPDVLCDAEATLALARPMLPRIRAAGYRAAFVGQNGASPDLPWDEFDVMFIGGDDNFKLGPEAGALIHEARCRGKWCHVGRVNSYKRMRVCAAVGVHSVDGTGIKFAPDKNVPKVLDWLDRLNAEPLLNATAEP